MPRPYQITVRAYQVGFGDCFLLTFHYKSGEDRHLLIDFGSTGAPRGFGNLVQVARSIEQECGGKDGGKGKLHAVVATHRHKDHISGFATQKDGEGPGDIIASLKPDLIIQPWTESPDAAPDATRLDGAATDSRAFVRTLQSMHVVAGSVLMEARRMAAEAVEIDADEAEGDEEEPAEAPGRKRASPLLRKLEFMGDNNLANRSAIENLMRMGKRRGAKARYVCCGSDSGLGEILPGVKVRVLGPPTLEQTSTIRQQRQRDESEFWHFQAQASRFAAGTGKAAGKRLFDAPVYASAGRPKPCRWLLRRLRSIRGEQLREMVRILDKAMNNTSVILLFEVGRQKLLFPGDAQIENWQYALSQKKIRDALKKVTFYKVGHHGSLNATPKSLWNEFETKSPDDVPTRLRTIVSTMRGKHGDTRRDTEVPRETLVKALKSESAFATTQDIKVKDKILYWKAVLEV